MKKLLFVAMGMAAASAMADITLDGATFVSSNTTVSEKVTGSGYYVVTGGATLTLANAENDFTGGVIVSNGVVEATASGAFGNGGTIRLDGTGDLRQVSLNAEKGTFNNPIFVTGKAMAYKKDYPAIYVKKAATLTGEISLDQNISGVSAAYVVIRSGTGSSNKPSLTVDAEVNCGAGRLYVGGWGSTAFKRKVTVANSYFGYDSSDTGSVYFYSPDNDIKAAFLGSYDISTMADNVLKGCSLQFNWAASWYANGHCIVKLNGHDQEFRTLHSQADPTNLGLEGYACGFETGAKSPCTITVNGRGGQTQSGNAYIRLMGPISMVVDKVEPMESGWNMYQALTKRHSANEGSFTVKKGQFRFLSTAQFPNVTNLTVTGGSMTFEKNASNVFTGLKAIDIQNTGYISTEPGCVAPICSEQAILRMDAGATMRLAAGVTNTVKKLFVDGKQMPAGIYTKDNLRQLRRYDEPSSETYYTGALVVLKGRLGLIVSIQ